MNIDINHFRKPVKQRDLEDKEYGWGYSIKGPYIGMKMTLTIEYLSLRPLLIHQANRHESSLYSEIMDELRGRRLSRKEIPCS